MACDCDDVRSFEQIQREYYCNALASSSTPPIDYEYISNTVCDLATDTWHYITTPYIDGVAGTPTNIDSGIPCSESQPIEPKIEDISVCDAVTGTIHAIVNQYSYPDPTDLTNVVVTQLSDVDTLIKCNEDVIDDETVTVCNGGFVEYHTFRTTNGVRNTIPTVEVSAIACDVVNNTPQQDQTHVVVTGSNTAIPAGLKTVTINNITGITTVAGGYELGNGRRDISLSLNATELSEVRGLLPALTVAGGTWQWIGLQPINEQ